MAHTGQCLCGEIAYEFPNDPAMSGVCHCKNCQRQAGSAFSTLAGVPKAEFKMSGAPKLYQDSDTDSGSTVERFFLWYLWLTDLFSRSKPARLALP